MKSSVVFVYNSFKDPLFQATLWLYLKEESNNQRFCFHLITYEQKEYHIEEEERRRIQEDLKSLNIQWHPLTWHSGRFKLLKKLFDLLSAFLLVFRIKVFTRASSIVSLGTVAGSFAYILAKMFFLKCYIYQFERHSEFLADFGIWSKNSLSYKLLHRLETISGRGSELLATGTTHMIERLKNEGIKGLVYYLPSCVDDEMFQFDQKSREEIRNRLEINEKRVIIYVGKFGGIYFTLNNMASFFSDWMKMDSTVFFIVLTPQNQNEVKSSFHEHGITEKQCFVSSVAHNEIPAYLSASDIGLVAVPSLPSQKFRSPIKVGEYLCCGLPYVVGHGISDDDLIAKKSSVGVVIDSYNIEGISKIQPELDLVMSRKRDDLRLVGIQYRGFSELKKTGKQIFDSMYNL